MRSIVENRFSAKRILHHRQINLRLKVSLAISIHDQGVTVTDLLAKLTAREAKHAGERQKENELAAARDATAADELELRDLRKRTRLQVEADLRAMRVAIRTQVAAQYGKDSDELASVGLKKTSEYKRRGPKAKAPAVPV